jgi:hypothetical protein
MRSQHGGNLHGGDHVRSRHRIYVVAKRRTRLFPPVESVNLMGFSPSRYATYAVHEVLHRPASCNDHFGMQFPQCHNRQTLAWIVLLSTVLGNTVDQSGYVFNDACFTREQHQKPRPENQLHFVSTGYLS